jgi:hypothetical protein
MEAARQRDEAMSAPAESATPVESIAPVAGEEPALIDVETGGPLAAKSVAVPAPETAAATVIPPPAPTSAPPKVEELVICSVHGEVLHQWQCRSVDVWISFFEFVSQRGQRLAQALPLGKFDRLEIQSGDSRAVVIIAADRGVMVKTGKQSVLK